jgi:hypothetical protein
MEVRNACSCAPGGERSAPTRSAVTTQRPRAILMKYAPRFIRAKRVALNIPDTQMATYDYSLDPTRLSIS